MGGAGLCRRVANDSGMLRGLSTTDSIFRSHHDFY